MQVAEPTRKILFSAYAALLILLAVSAGAANEHFSHLEKLLIALLIAAAKCAIVFWIFMQLKYQRGLVRIFALVGFFWLAIMAGLIFADYLTRGAG
ncbi:MAG TPA: cytochrome C oxidase subunit IV family protein [Opitutaceae bacterium]|nr:cytochrome C oxidase subunit IV family protein [Opitutaceae bacterium]